jgi:hypothetical protein
MNRAPQSAHTKSGRGATLTLPLPSPPGFGSLQGCHLQRGEQSHSERPRRLLAVSCAGQSSFALRALSRPGSRGRATLLERRDGDHPPPIRKNDPGVLPAAEPRQSHCPPPEVLSLIFLKKGSGRRENGPGWGHQARVSSGFFGTGVYIFGSGKGSGVKKTGPRYSAGLKESQVHTLRG